MPSRSQTGDSLWSGLARSVRRIFARQTDLETLFRHFQGVLDCNNQALEVMTDMGEKLGGDYIFDINYTKGAYTALSDHIACSLYHFQLLTENKYSRLEEVHARIDDLVRRMLTSAGPLTGKLVLFFNEITWDLAEEVGGKNYHLAEIQNRLKLQTPAAFALTTAAFDLFVQHNSGLADRIEALARKEADLETELAALRTEVRQGSFPEPLAAALDEALDEMRSRQGRDCRLAVRSSAEEEDGDFSFAGQFATVLNVSCTAEAVQRAYKEVIASLFRSGSVAYQRHLGYDPGQLRMAVGCVAMIDARTSGVIFTAAGSDRETMLINAAWGLGMAVVDGLTDADLYRVCKGDEPEIVETRMGRKEKMVVNRPEEGIETVETPPDLRGKLCLTEAQVLELARQAARIEAYYKTPQDIEWTIDAEGRCYILQARTLRLEREQGEAEAEAVPPATVPEDQPVLLRNQGVVVQKGTTAGPVFILHHADDLDQVPRGAVLVARNDSPHFVRAIPFLNAIMTDVGVPTSHMASICREFNIPTVVNTGNGTTLLTQGQEITLQAGDDGEVTVYEGVVPGLLRHYRHSGLKMRELYEFRRQKYIMRYIAPLHLVNPLEEEFVPEKCQTVHDLIRFMHEKAVQELVANASGAGRGLPWFKEKRPLRRLQLPIPVQLLLIDIGGGVSAAQGKTIEIEQVTSVPLRAILNGMTEPGVWHGGSVALHGKDLLSSITRAADFAETAGGEVGNNLAVISREYLNLSLRFGYHFNVLDCYCSSKPRNNHIFFRFVGGAAAITSRSRRIQLMAAVLAESGFTLKTKGDLLVARISNLSCPDIEKILAQIGRLIGYTRQLDAVLDSDETVDRLVKDFLSGNYITR
jgi:pyruvate,water dikinase